MKNGMKATLFIIIVSHLVSSKFIRIEIALNLGLILRIYLKLLKSMGMITLSKLLM